jgi:hypothetical protein
MTPEHRRTDEHMNNATVRMPAPHDRPAGPAGQASVPAPAVGGQQALLDNLGGPSGMVYTALPVVVFVTANAFYPLPTTIVIAIAAGLAVTGWRLLRGERLMPALGGLFGVTAAGAIAAWTGSATGFFLIGIWASLVGTVALLASLLLRRPLTGVLWNAIHGGKHPWREDPPSLRAHDVATLAATAVFAARFALPRRRHGLAGGREDRDGHAAHSAGPASGPLGVPPLIQATHRAGRAPAMTRRAEARR